jgi:hypothetical protein
LAVSDRSASLSVCGSEPIGRASKNTAAGLRAAAVFFRFEVHRDSGTIVPVHRKCRVAHSSQQRAVRFISDKGSRCSLRSSI